MKNILILGCALLVAESAAQERSDVLAALVRDSPFLPPGGAPAVENGPAQLEFRGVVSEPDGYSFSVFDQGRHEAAWVRINEPGQAFVVRRYDAEQDTLTVEYNQQTLTLPLKRAKVQAMAAAPPPAPPPPLPTNLSNPAAPPPAASAGATNAQEAERLMRIAEEIRRRRGLRQMPQNAQPPAKP